MHSLDNPIYNSLITAHSGYAISHGSARRYRPELTPFVGMELGGTDDVLELVGDGERFVMIGVLPELSSFVRVESSFEVLQMTCSEAQSVDSSEIQLLGSEHVQDMVDLTSVVYPRYFKPGTASLGDYYGIYDKSTLVAMAGVRMAMPGFKEISAICTHLDYRGKGLASKLTRYLSQKIIEGGDVPFLHTESDNPAQELYSKLGFKTRKNLQIAICWK